MPFEMGPVLRFETRRYAGRKGWYAFRVAFSLALLAFLGLFHYAFWLTVRNGRPPATAKQFVAERLTSLLVVTHLIIAFLVAPIAAADAFSRERVRTMLPSLLVTELSARRIVWETFAARLIPGLSVWLCLVPITAFLVPWWGMGPTFIAIMEGVTFGSILLSVAATAAFSLWSGRTFYTLVGAYGLLGAWLLWRQVVLIPGPMRSWIARANPYGLLAGRWNGTGPPTMADAGFFVGVSALVTIALLTVMSATLRRVILASPRSMPGRRTRFAMLRAALVLWPAWLPGPTLDANPVLWREWWRARTSVGWRAFWILYAGGALAATLLGALAFWGGQYPPDVIGVAGYEVGIGLLAVAVRSASAWSEEKAAGREGLDLLLSTPMSASTIVMGKWWGAYRAVLVVALLPTLAALILAAGAPTLPPGGTIPAVDVGPLNWIDRSVVPVVLLGQVLGCGAAFVSLGLFLATRLARGTRAVFVTVGVYIAVAWIAPTVSEIFFLRWDRPLSMGLGSVSPLGGPIAILMSLFFSPYFVPTRHILPFALAWLCLMGGLAWVLTRRTIQRFDVWMGRMPSPPE